MVAVQSVIKLPRGDLVMLLLFFILSDMGNLEKIVLSILSCSVGYLPSFIGLELSRL